MCADHVIASGARQSELRTGNRELSTGNWQLMSNRRGRQGTQGTKNRIRRPPLSADFPDYADFRLRTENRQLTTDVQWRATQGRSDLAQRRRDAEVGRTDDRRRRTEPLPATGRRLLIADFSINIHCMKIVVNMKRVGGTWAVCATRLGTVNRPRKKPSRTHLFLLSLPPTSARIPLLSVDQHP